MKISLLGTGGAWPDADRCAPAFLVQHKEKPYLIDCGGGVNHQLMKVKVPPSKLDNIFLTHIHIDHCVELPSLVFGAYLTGKEGSFHLYGPKGASHFATSLFTSTYDFAVPMMKKLRNKDISIVTKEIENGVVFEEDGLTVETIPVDHGIETLAYKFSADGKTVVFSGDTAPCKNIVDLAHNVDLLIIECSFPESSGVKSGHCIPSQVGKIAMDSGAKSVVLIHLFPPCKDHEEEIVADVKKVYGGQVVIGQDLQIISV
jgi:ribonuclease BN (tRNA processing enzyme)